MDYRLITFMTEVLKQNQHHVGFFTANLCKKKKKHNQGVKKLKNIINV